jgi:glycosyltransferase involved in cell wall biosynthesis
VDGVLQPENKTGYWRMIADVPQAIAAVRKIYFNRQLGQKMGANGRSFVQQYTLEIVAEHWHRIFQRVVNQQAPLRITAWRSSPAFG